jgi:phosphohistidine phosphatase
MPSKRLVLLRHAKSSWSDPAVADHDRPLNGRGRQAAVLVGGYVRRIGLRPDLVLCSSATRARQTLDLLHLDEHAQTRISIEDELYGADAGQLLTRLRRIPPTVRCVLLVGHNPGVEELAQGLLGQGIPWEEKFPTGALVDLRVQMPAWSDLHPGIAELGGFVVPRDLN